MVCDPAADRQPAIAAQRGVIMVVEVLEARKHPGDVRGAAAAKGRDPELGFHRAIGPGHVTGGVARSLERAGLEARVAEEWESRVAEGAVLIGGHASSPAEAEAVREQLADAGASRVVMCSWPDQ